MPLIWAALAGMVVYLDTTAIAQILICQPIIACPLWGYLAGEPEIGFIIGVIFQLIWLGNLQIGAARFAEGNIGAFISVALATNLPNDLGMNSTLLLVIAVVIGLLAAHFGSHLAPMVRRIVGRLVPNFVSAAENGESNRFYSWFSLAVGIHLLAGFAYSILWLGVGTLVLHYLKQPDLVTRLSGFFSDTTSVSNLDLTTMGAIFGAGCAIAFRVLLRKKAIPLFLVAAVIGTIVLVWFLNHQIDLSFSMNLGEGR